MFTLSKNNSWGKKTSFKRGTKYPLTSSVWHYFSISPPPPDLTFMPSTSETGPATRPHPFDIHVIHDPTFTVSMSSDGSTSFCLLSTAIDHRRHSFHFHCWTLFCRLSSTTTPLTWPIARSTFGKTRYVFCKKWHLQIMFEISLFLDVEG
jgi:hypothetical protein